MRYEQLTRAQRERMALVREIWEIEHDIGKVSGRTLEDLRSDLAKLDQNPYKYFEDLDKELEA